MGCSASRHSHDNPCLAYSVPCKLRKSEVAAAMSQCRTLRPVCRTRVVVGAGQIRVCGKPSLRSPVTKTHFEFAACVETPDGTFPSRYGRDVGLDGASLSIVAIWGPPPARRFDFAGPAHLVAVALGKAKCAVHSCAPSPAHASWSNGPRPFVPSTESTGFSAFNASQSALTWLSSAACQAK